MRIGSTPTDGGARLERRFRRLLVAYPASYRAEREDELVGVLMDDAGPDQRAPSPAVAIDLLRAGLVTRLRLGREAPAVSPWRDSVAIVTVLLPMLLAVRVIRPMGVVFRFAVSFERPEWTDVASRGMQGWAAPVAWVVVAAAVLFGRARLAAMLAVVATLIEAIFVAGLAFGPRPFNAHGPIAFVVIEVGACALLWRRGGIERGLTLLGRRSIIGAAAGVGLVYLAATGVVLTGAVQAVGSALATTIGLGLLAQASWSNRELLKRQFLWCRLCVPAAAAYGVLLVAEQVRRRWNFGVTTPAVLLLELGLCILAGVVVVVSALAVVAGSRAMVRQIRRAP